MSPFTCPVCSGSGKVSRPPWVAGDAPSWTSAGGGPYPCNACVGTGIVWAPEVVVTSPLRLEMNPATTDGRWPS